MPGGETVCPVPLVGELLPGPAMPSGEAGAAAPGRSRILWVSRMILRQFGYAHAVPAIPALGRPEGRCAGTTTACS